MGLLQNSSLLIKVRRTSERDIEAKHVGKVGTRGYLSLGDWREALCGMEKITCEAMEEFITEGAQKAHEAKNKREV